MDATLGGTGVVFRMGPAMLGVPRMDAPSGTLTGVAAPDLRLPVLAAQIDLLHRRLQVMEARVDGMNSLWTVRVGLWCEALWQRIRHAWPHYGR